MSVTSRLLSMVPIVGTKFQRLIGEIIAIRAELAELRARSDGLADAVSAIGQAQTAAQSSVQGAIQADVGRLDARVGMLIHQLGEDMERMAAGYESNTIRVARQEAELASLRSAVEQLQTVVESLSTARYTLPEGVETVKADALFADLARQWSARAGSEGTADGLRALYLQLARQYSEAACERAVLEERVAALSGTIENIRKDVGNRVVEAAEANASLAAPFPAAVADAIGELPVTVVDVGAQMLTSEDHVYASLMADGHCRVIGFEPLEEAADKRTAAEPGVMMLNHFIGKGGPASFQINYFDPTSSLLEPNLDYLRQFYALADMCRPVKRLAVETTRLDDIAEVGGCDYLKIDVQGGELDVLLGAERLLERVLFVHTEVEFEPIYVDQPLFPDIDRFLRARGFELLDLTKLGHSGYAALPRQQARTKLTWADAIYVKTTDRLADQGAAALLKAAYIAHVNYRMYDFAAHLIARHDQAAGSNLLSQYLTATGLE
ncbi:FkbM family methyltransferase [Azospirillum thermophilum]|uniref:Methyltransferase FkbM domain-containing protein n=1 Tax=Azospirillum thermophilum TaxID=2202148 RepID=A0A2S2D0A2_9PROT|nr:FkbM family methyltransferase [Azospirillum thermophilum]AWK90191.1 hypothetical protein DEW08_29705 [Azospirillum thermophilum]